MLAPGAPCPIRGKADDSWRARSGCGPRARRRCCERACVVRCRRWCTPRGRAQARTRLPTLRATLNRFEIVRAVGASGTTGSASLLDVPAARASNVRCVPVCRFCPATAIDDGAGVAALARNTSNFSGPPFTCVRKTRSLPTYTKMSRSSFPISEWLLMTRVMVGVTAQGRSTGAGC